MTSNWKHPVRKLKLSPDHIDIWRTTLKLPSQKIGQYHALLSREEKKLAGKYKSDKRRNQFIISRGLLRTLIGQYLKLDPAGFEFSYSEHQKPYLPVAELGVPVTFNITHSHQLAMVALSLERMIGIDTEHVRHDIDFRKLAKRFFSQQESALLETYDASELPAAFFSCWTRKEAFVKALGDGISFGLSEFSVSVDPNDNEITLHTHWEKTEAGKWSIMNIPSDKDYVAAVAAGGGKYKLRLWNAVV